MLKNSSKALGVAAVLAASMAGVSHANTSYPTKPISLIVPLGAGGATDVVARVIAEKLGVQLGQQVIIENRPGAEGALVVVFEHVDHGAVEVRIVQGRGGQQQPSFGGCAPRDHNAQSAG